MMFLYIKSDKQLILSILMLASEFLYKLKQIKKQDLTGVKGLGEVLCQNFEDFVNSPRFDKLLEDFKNLESNNINLNITHKTTKTQENLPLSSEIICITGTFEISRTEIKEKLENLGATTTDSVSSKTTILLAGQSAGSKLAKATQLGIKIITDLNQIIN